MCVLCVCILQTKKQRIVGFMTCFILGIFCFIMVSITNAYDFLNEILFIASFMYRPLVSTVGNYRVGHCHRTHYNKFGKYCGK